MPTGHHCLFSAWLTGAATERQPLALLGVIAISLRNDGFPARIVMTQQTGKKRLEHSLLGSLT
jgi:hypothetical protein